MRRSFGGGGNGMGWGGAPGAGGGGGGGNGIFRSVSRVSSRAGMGNVQDASSSSSSSSSSSAARKASKRGLCVGGSKPAGIYPTLSNSNFGSMCPPWPLRSDSSICDESDWVCVDDEVLSGGSEIEVFDDYVFGSAPSQFEAQAALLSIQHALPTSPHPDSDWNEPSLYPYGYEQAICSDISRVYDAFHLLQTDPSVQRMVISLSSDRAVWKAVLNNEAVRELREAFCKDEADASESSGNESNPSASQTNVLSWIFNNMRAKLMDFLAGITDLMKELFQPPGEENVEFPEGFGELVRASFMLTAIVLLVVVVTRASHA